MVQDKTTENKQNINNIKAVAKLHNEGQMNNLYKDISEITKKLAAFRDAVKAKREDFVKKARVAKLTENYAKPTSPEPEKEEVKLAPAPVKAKETPAPTAVVEKREEQPKAASQQQKSAPAQKQQQIYRRPENQRPERQFNNKFQNNQNGPRDNKQGQGQRPFGQKPFGPNQGQKPFGQGQNRFGKDGKPMAAGQKPFGPKPGFNAKTAKADLTSAASVFVNKSRDYQNNSVKKKTYEKSGEDKKLNKKSLMRRGLVEEKNIEERMVSRKLKIKKPKNDVPTQVAAPVTHAVITTPNLTVKLLSEQIGKPVTEIIKQFMVLGIMTTINSTIDFAAAELVSSELGVTLELKLDKTAEEQLQDVTSNDNDADMEKRPPIVTVMGHVDHGKTSLLDYIRKTDVISGEAGGITQHIGAYSITWNKEPITFIDTPGHEAFASMRARGAEITDIAVLIVAADDGVKPQTVEAINHIKAAKVPMIVAINKIDKPEANIERIKQQLVEYEVIPEEWGGDAIMVPVSAKKGEGIDKLLEMILLVAEMQDLKANKNRNAVACVVEAKLDKGKGPIANVIIQNGTLKVGDTIVTGFTSGRVRGIVDDKGKSVKSAGPSSPVSILGLGSVPNVGDTLQVVDEKLIKSVIEERKAKMAQDKVEKGLGTSLNDFFNTPAGHDKKALNLIIKSDVQGSAEALKQMLLKVNNEEAEVKVIHSGVGAITETDVQLAQVSNAIIIGFNIKAESKAASLAEHNKVEIRNYSIIYEALDDVERAIKGMQAPKYEEKVTGHAEVRMLFKISSVGTIAGSRVIDGKIVRNGAVKVLRNDKVIFEGKIASLKREKDEAKEVASGFECGIKVDGFNDILEGDIIECIVKERIEIK